MKKGFKDYMAEANACVESCSIQDALHLHGNADWVFIGVRDASELAKEGKIPGAVHASRGLLEFKIDPESPMHDSTFDPNKRFVFYCGTGGRSALAVQRALEMGLKQVVSMAGGFSAWKAADGPVETS